MKNKIIEGIYIRNVEAIDAFKMGIGEREELSKNWSGFIPYSLELIKLEEMGMKIDKNKTLDIVNLNFKIGYKLREELEILDNKKKEINDKLKGDNNKSKIEKLREELESIKEEIRELENKSIKIDKLREELYQHGFVDENGIKFVLYKRSGSKSRQGKVMFIREELVNNMLNWGRMDLNFPIDKEIDVVGLGAYSSLVSSQIEDTIHIDGKGILLIEDIKSSWKQDCKIVKKGREHLEVVEGVTTLESCPTDGSSLLDKSYFKEGQDFKLLRNHMFKSCAFKCNIQLFYMDYCKEHGIDYNTFKVKDMFNREMLAKDVKLIITPNSLKVLKFEDVVGGKEEMYKYWKEYIKKDGDIFGICKHNKASKWQFEGLEYQQMSYQMVNSLPLSKEELEEVCKWEIKYVDKLKNDINIFKDYLHRTKNDMNCNEAMVGILSKNKEFEKTELFRKFRSKTINKYVDKLKSGKIKNIGDYCTIIANPLEYLKATVGAYKEEELSIKGDNIYTKLFSDGEELVCFRNPHTSQANVLVAKNVYNEEIERYFNFGRNIVVVNCINNAICQILSGADFDSDTMLIMNNKILVEAGKRCYGYYKICENGIERDGNKYTLSNLEMASIDNKLSKSKNDIGQVVNLGQLALSKYWNLKNNGATDQELEETQKIIDVMTIMSGCAIDNAKKQFAINIEEEIRYIRKKLEITKKPKFWKYVSEDKRLKNEDFRKENLVQYNTSMDLLEEVLDCNLKKGKSKGSVDLKELLIEGVDVKKGNRKQQQKILESLESLDKKITKNMNEISKGNEEEKYREIDLDIENTLEYLLRKTIKKETMLDMLLKVSGVGQADKVNNYKKIGCRLIMLLHRKNKEELLEVFKKSQK